MNLGWLAATTVYMVVVLTAMQVGLATEALAKNSAFQSASYGFTVFSILGPLVCAGLIVVAFVCMLVFNTSHTIAQMRKREEHFGTQRRNRGTS